MFPYHYVEQSGPRHWLVKFTTGQNSEIVDTASTKRSARAICRRLNRSLNPYR